MIPKILHYCWFGKKEKPLKIQRCIDSWYKYLPDYQILEWNESNFDYEKLQYTREAYKAGKYAFVSDVARVKALYEMGGIYLDTDVEVFKSFDDVLHSHCVFGFEEKNYVATSFMACEAGSALLYEFYAQYKKIPFVQEEKQNLTTNVMKLTDILEQKGLKRDNSYQMLNGIIEVYPQEYFSPYDYINCINLRTEKSYCIHYFYVTWQSWKTKVKKAVKMFLGKVLGKKRMDKLRGYNNG